MQGHFLDMGTGKTFVFTAVALYFMITRKASVLVAMPPILLPQWEKWLRMIKPCEGVAPFTITNYSGTPSQRAKKSLDANFVLVGYQIFRKEYAKIKQHYEDREVIVGNDEGQDIAGIKSEIHERMYAFCLGRPRAILTGTPANNPLDAYGILKFTNPGKYRNYVAFEAEHGAAKDFFGKPTEFVKLEKIYEHLQVNSVRILFSEMYPNSEKPLIVPIHYDLAPDHQKLYKRLVDEQMLALPSGGKIDATTENRLIHALGQIVLNWGHFSGDESDVSACIELIEQKLREMGGKKLLVFAHYKMTVARLAAYFGDRCAGAINSVGTPAQKERAKMRFIEDDKAQIVVVQTQSGGKGLDGWQHVCHHMIFVEPNSSPRDFWQAVRRLARTGQRNRVMVMLAIANKTLQGRRFNQLIDNDNILNKVIRNDVTLKQLLYGE